MVVKKIPQPLHSLCIQSLCQAMLQQWKNTYYTNYLEYSECFIQETSVLIPPAIHDQVFDLMVDSHARFIQNKKTFIPSVSALVNSIISTNLTKLNIHCLRHIGTVPDEELEFLHAMLISKLPYLNNLVEINLQTSGKDFTLPICTDETLEVIGLTCSKLTNLDISYNHNVTDIGLEFLVPSKKQTGCPKLVKVLLFECSVTHQGIVSLLKGLSKLKFLGYRETGQALRVLHNASLSMTVQPVLELAHINNLGKSSRTCKNTFKLECNSTLVNIISKLCPKLNGLKIRVIDSDVKFLHEINTFKILCLVYNLGKPSSPGNNTVQYLQLCGTQFEQLSFVCDIFSTHHLKAICEQCNNLKSLNISSNKFNCDVDIIMSDYRNNVLTNLEEFKFKPGFNIGFDQCHIPSNIFKYVLHKSYVLTEMVLTMRNTLYTDLYIESLFSSIATSNIKKIGIEVPFDKNELLSPLNLTMVTVETLIGMCPELIELGNLLMWDVSVEEVEGLKRQLQLTNSALVLR